MARAQVVSGLVQTVAPAITSGLYRNDSDGTEVPPGITNDVMEANVDKDSPFQTQAKADCYQGIKCFGVFEKDEELNGDGLV